MVLACKYQFARKLSIRFRKNWYLQATISSIKRVRGRAITRAGLWDFLALMGAAATRLSLSPCNTRRVRFISMYVWVATFTVESSTVEWNRMECLLFIHCWIEIVFSQNQLLLYEMRINALRSDPETNKYRDLVCMAACVHNVFVGYLGDWIIAVLRSAMNVRA